MAVIRAQSPARIAGRYTVQGELGAGGVGAVYRVRDEVTGQLVALKQLLPQRADKRAVLEAMLGREYHTLSRLKHPRVIDVYDYGRSELGPYYTMELLDGADLRSRAPLPYRLLCQHLRDVASCLALLHAQRLVHRDVSPRNVCFSADGRAKLIDFGALHAFGAAQDVVGTPPCIAPEALRHMPLDHRTDLYALGAVAYFALTGRHAYNARSLGELPAVWSRAPARLRELVPELPAALDQLVMGLLSADPAERPATDAEVIDQLTAIGELPAEELPAITSYLSSSRMVGRDEEVAWVDERIRRCVSGRGTAILLEGPTGIGRTRLLHELGLRAQLLGAAVLKVDAAAHPRPFATAARLALQLLEARPDASRTAARNHAATLSQLSEDVSRALAAEQAERPAEDARKRRSQLQVALVEWLRELCRTDCVVLAVDNLDQCDEPSAAFLATMSGEARRLRLLVLATQRTGVETEPAAALLLLRKRAASLQLGRLSLASCEQLVCSLFGDVENTRPIAQLLYDRSGGNPQLCIELAQLLVKHEIAKYVSGSWLLPSGVDPSLLPNRDQVLIRTRLSELGRSARTLAEVLSLHHDRVPLDLCLAWSEAASEGETHAALHELLGAQVLLEEQGEYRFAQCSLREALLAQMDAAARRRRHRAVAERLSSEPSLDAKVATAWHLMEAGEETLGADALARIGYACFQSQRMGGETDTMVRALERGAEVYARHGRSPAEQCALLLPLVTIASYRNLPIVARHSERALSLALEFTGLLRAQRLSRSLPGKLSLLCGVGPATLALQLRKSRLGFDLREAMVMFSNAGFVAIVECIARYDTEAIARLRALLAPLALFGDALPGMIYRFAASQLALSEGRFGDALAQTEHDKLWLKRPEIVRALGEERKRQLYFSILATEAMLATSYLDDDAEELLLELDALALAEKYIVFALRATYHARRGEAELARFHMQQSEQLSIQETAGLRSDYRDLVASLELSLLSGDAIELRRVSERLWRRAERVPSLVPYARAAQAAYLTLRGEFGRALPLVDLLMHDFHPWTRVVWPSVLAACADTLNRAGEHARAEALMLRALADWAPVDQRFAYQRIPLERQLALAEAALTRTQDATARVDGLLERHAGKEHPLLLGLLHKTRAEIALCCRDALGFEQAYERMSRHFRLSKNPALIAQCAQLAARAVEAGLRAGATANEAGTRREGEPFLSIYRTLPEITVANDRHEYALRLIVQQAAAQSGWLYRLGGQTLHLVASTSIELPASDLEAELRALIEQRTQELRQEQRGDPELTDAAPRAASSDATALSGGDKTLMIDATEPVEELSNVSNHRAHVLCTHRRGRPVVVGGVLLFASSGPPAPLAAAFLEAVADALHARGVLTEAS